ncbi:DUF1149 family protein [Lactobacillus rodentium]|uniref:Transposase n=1 Tax=Lactobacillus rodentium TaxID=947835 RepID=A0A2Z6T7E5_9LACO|nr:DUF1149 family protein [Lactobacillus rodentium]MCR1895089.1 DUF1149 family protein [Lactobacillus rodentium]GBG05374.1 transposase [Lactobacillus rodentium]
MEIKKMTPVLAQHFHYDLNEEPHIKNELNVSLRQVFQTDEQGNQDEGKEGHYFEIAIPFEIAPAPGQFSVSGLVSQVVQLIDYFGEGRDLNPNDYELISRPLVEEIETLTYQITQITLDQPVNLNFKSNFDQLNFQENQNTDKN